MKKNVFLTTSLLAILAGVAGCNNQTTSSSTSSTVGGTSSTITNSSNPSSNTSSTQTSSSSSSSEVITHTEALTEEMFASFQKGYASTFTTSTLYEGSETPSRKLYEVKVNNKNNAWKFYTYITREGEEVLVLSQDYQYQINPETNDEMLYEAGLTIGNTVHYEPVIGRDPYTYQDIHLTWEESYYSNVFAYLTIDNFERVGEENKFALNVSNFTLENNGVYEMIDIQFFGEAVPADIEYFYLLTNGNKITGFELKYEDYLSFENMVYKNSSGIFTDSGEDVVDFVKPLEGRTKDADFDAAIASLKNYNYEVYHEQGGYDFTANKFVGRGHFEGEADGETLNYYYFNNDGAKILNYTYYNIVDPEDGQTYLQGATKINGNYYNDVAYYGTLSDMLPSFNISSEMFIKSSESTDTVLVYNLDESIKISKSNNNSFYSSFDSDGYNDLTIHLKVTIDKSEGTVQFYNATSALIDSGLYETVTYSNIGGVEKMITADNVFDNCDDLTWEDLLSNDEVSLSALKSKVPVDLSSLPTFGGRYAVVHFSQNILYTNTYFEGENEELITSYGAKLVEAGFTNETTNEDEDPSYSNVFTKGSRSYKLTLTLGTYWNSGRGWGQFQVTVAVSAA